MDTRKKQLWRAREQGQVPGFVALTVETTHWRSEPERVPWVAELRRRARCLRCYRELAESSPKGALARVCHKFGLGERTLYRWQSLYRQGGLEALIPESRRPEHSPRQTTAELEWAIIAIRLRTGWGVQRIAAELNALGLGPLTHSAVHGVLARRAVKVPLVRRSRRAGCRYERERPNDLWHMDLKGPLHFGRGMPALYGVAILDDHSRFCVGASFADNKRMDTALAVLEEAVRQWGAPR
jgi:transposase-like protein